MARASDMQGRQFGQLTVLSGATTNHEGRAMWLCLCTCGVRKNITGKNLRSGRTKSCGCLVSTRIIKTNTKHGHAKRHKRSPEYHVWYSMWARCTNSKNKDYKHYGGRGIQVCEEWMQFEQFLAEMGPRPEAMTLDRIDFNGNYEKDNCRWVVWSVQAKNKRKSQSRKNVQCEPRVIIEEQLSSDVPVMETPF